MTVEQALRDFFATRECPMCGRVFRPGRLDQQFCGQPCRKKAWRLRRQAPPSSPAVPPPGRPLRPVTVYECQSCGSRSLGSQRCDDCNTFGQKVGIGGLCPHCSEPVAVSDLVDDDLSPARP